MADSVPERISAVIEAKGGAHLVVNNSATTVVSFDMFLLSILCWLSEGLFIGFGSFMVVVTALHDFPRTTCTTHGVPSQRGIPVPGTRRISPFNRARATAPPRLESESYSCSPVSYLICQYPVKLGRSSALPQGAAHPVYRLMPLLHVYLASRFIRDRNLAKHARASEAVDGIAWSGREHYHGRSAVRSLRGMATG